MTKPKPILVVGANRSGTTWLSNLLCNHEDVAGIQSPNHFGILETNMFGRMQRIFGDLKNDLNWCAFVATWGKTDFFFHTGLETSFLSQDLHSVRSYSGIFNSVMNAVAAKQGTRFWLEKLPPNELKFVSNILPNAKIIVIQRDLIPKLASKFQLLNNGQKNHSVIRSVAEYVLQNKCAEILNGNENAIFIRYERLANDTSRELKKICDFVGLEYSDKLINNNFRRNTSFTDQADENRPNSKFSATQKLLIYLVYGIATCIPRFMLLQAFELFNSNEARFITGTFSHFESTIVQEDP